MPTYHAKRRSPKRRRQILIARLLFAVCCLVLLGLIFWLGRTIFKAVTGNSTSSTPAQSQSEAAASSFAQSDASSTPEADQLTAQQTEAEAQEAQWSQNGKDFMAWLKTQSGFESLDLTVQENYPYFLCVNRAASCVTVYVDDGTGQYTQPYAAMVCSGGSDTPTGIFNTPVQYPWRLLAGNVYGQYSTRIWDAYLFHSVPYYTQHKDDLEYDEFNKLGTPASLGCIRLAVADVKWIFDECKLGTPVVIYDNESDPGPLGKPDTLTIDPSDEDRRGWDPTDPDPANPYGEEFIDGTAIRTAAAKADWEQYKQNGLREGLTPTLLQGWSHDSSVVGTRG